MSDVLSGPFVDFLSRVVLPGLSVVLALLTLGVLWFTLRKAGLTLTRSVKPQIECYLRIRPSSQVFDFVIANFGLGSAYQVTFRLQVDEEDFATHDVIMEQRGTDFPFSVIEPGGCITNLFGVGVSLLGKDPPLQPFEAAVTYEWQPFWSSRRCTETRHYELDVRPFRGLVWERKENDVAEALKAGLQQVATAVGATNRPPVRADRKSSGGTFFERIDRLMPDLFAEMRADLKSSPLKREFILMPKRAHYNAGRKRPLAYYYEEHKDLEDKVGLLVNEGAVTDITYNSVDRYVMSEALVEYLGSSLTRSSARLATSEKEADPASRGELAAQKPVGDARRPSRRTPGRDRERKPI